MSSNLCLISPHLLEDGEVNIDLLDAGILLLKVEREEDLSRVAGPELTELKLLLTFPWPQAPTRAAGNNLEAKVATSVLEQHRSRLVEKAESELLSRCKQGLKSSGSVRKSVHLNNSFFSGSSTNDNQGKTSGSGQSRLGLADKAEAGEEVGEEETGGELKVGQDRR